MWKTKPEVRGSPNLNLPRQDSRSIAGPKKLAQTLNKLLAATNLETSWRRGYPSKQALFLKFLSRISP